ARAWVFGDGNDPTLSRRLLSLLLKHRIEVHELERAVEVDGKRFEPGSAWVVPARQPAFRLAHAIFEFTPPVKGDVFYSGTSYAVAPGYGLRYAASRAALPAGPRVQEVPAVAGGVDGVARYAYALDLRDYGAYRLVGALLAQDIACVQPSRRWCCLRPTPRTSRAAAWCWCRSPASRWRPTPCMRASIRWPGRWAYACMPWPAARARPAST